MEMTIQEGHTSDLRRTFTSLVVPRPIGWISSRGSNGANIAPFSYFNGISTTPPVVMFSAGRNPRDGRRKDTAQNVRETEEFVVNVVAADLIEEMDATSEPLDRDTSEFEAFDIPTTSSMHVDVPRVDGSLACLECTLLKCESIYDSDVHFGEVVHIYVDDAVLTSGKVDARKVDTVGRLGGPYYTKVSPLSYTSGNEVLNEDEIDT